MRLEVVDEPSALAACAEDWNRLAEEAPQGLAMLTHTWVSAHLEHMLEPGERWLCASAWEGSELRGVLPVVVKPHASWATAGRTSPACSTGTPAAATR